jgi:hypothetical protein
MTSIVSSSLVLPAKLSSAFRPDQLHSENVGRRWDGLTHSYTDIEVDCPETDLSTAPSAPQCELTGTGLT